MKRITLFPAAVLLWLLSSCGTSSNPTSTAPAPNVPSTSIPVPAVNAQQQNTESQIAELKARIAELKSKIESGKNITRRIFIIERRFDTDGRFGVYQCYSGTQKCILVAEPDKVPISGEVRQVTLPVRSRGEQPVTMQDGRREFFEYFESAPEIDVAALSMEQAKLNDTLQDLIAPERITLRKQWEDLKQQFDRMRDIAESILSRKFESQTAGDPNEIRELLRKIESFDRELIKEAAAAIQSYQKVFADLDSFASAAKTHISLFPVESSKKIMTGRVDSLSQVIKEHDDSALLSYHRDLLDKLPGTAASPAILLQLIKTVSDAQIKDEAQWKSAIIKTSYENWIQREVTKCPATPADVANLSAEDLKCLTHYKFQSENGQATPIQAAIRQRNIDIELDNLTKLLGPIAAAVQKTVELDEQVLADARNNRQQAFDNGMSKFISGYNDVVRATGRRDLNLDVNVRSMNSINQQLRQYYQTNQDACLQRFKQNEVTTELVQMLADYKAGSDRLKSLNTDAPRLSGDFNKIKMFRDVLPDLPQPMLTTENIREALNGKKPAGENGPTAEPAATAAPATTADTELDRVMKLTGVAEFKGARLSVLMKRINDLANSKIDFDVGEELGKERVTIATEGKTVEAILNEAARQVGGRVETSATTVRIVRGAGRKQDDGKIGDTVRRIKDVIK